MNDARVTFRRTRPRPDFRLAGALLALLVGAGCDSDTTAPPNGDRAEVAVILNSIERSLTVVPVDSPDGAFTIGIAPDGSPVNLAARDGIVIVPLGTVPAAAVVDLALATVVHTVPLAAGSGATGAAFLNDSIALVGNPALNTVSPINVLRGTRGEDVAVGAYPHAIVAVNDTAYVLNAQLGPDFQPAGPGTISVITGSPPTVVATIALEGVNPGAAAVGNDAVYVLHAGHFGMNDGSLSIVDRSTLAETSHVTGFGDFPGSIVQAPDGQLVVAAFSYGLAVWDPGTGEFTNPPASPIHPGGVASIAGIGFDAEDRLYALEPNCTGPGSALRLDAAFEVEIEIETGICPVAVVFTELGT